MLKADYGELSDLVPVDLSIDMMFAWNGTASGVRVPNADWIPATARGCDLRCDVRLLCAAVDFEKLDVVTLSWQKALGGEGAHGMLALSPRAVDRLEILSAAVADAEDFPVDGQREAHGRHFRGRDHQHAFDAMRGGRSRLAAWAEAAGGLEG